MTLGLKAYRIMMGHLTRKTPDKKISDLIKTGKLKTADEIPQPPKKQEVENIEAFNEFNKRNPKADGGRMEFQDGTDIKTILKKNMGGLISDQRRAGVAQRGFGFKGIF